MVRLGGSYPPPAAQHRLLDLAHQATVCGACCAKRAVLALLHSNVGGVPLAWTALLLEDLRALLSRGVDGTAGLADPLDGADAWNALMHTRGKWDQIATDLLYFEASSDRRSHDDPEAIVRLF